MFDIAFTELLLVFAIALVILGPQRLPKVAAQLGKWVARARRTAMELRRQLEREIELDEVNRSKQPPDDAASPPAPAADDATSAPPPDRPGPAPPQPPASDVAGKALPFDGPQKE